MRRFVRIASAIIAVGCTPLVSGVVRAQGASAKPDPEDAATRNLPAGNAKLSAMILDQKLFAPDHWWQYKGPSTHRPGHYVAEQQGIVSVGGSLVRNHGAQVTYRVTAHPSAAVASKAFAAVRPTAHETDRTQTTVKVVKLGSEAVEVRQANTDATGATQFSAIRTVARYGRYVVDISGASDMKAFGPRPTSGTRAWLHEAVYATVRKAALERWDRAAELLTGAAAP
ncbi:MAG: hypothetical protein NT029_04935 [Armatimonadetes bacterium]|nr:hypothetical protein [Armatimonadota bacterium]